MDNLIKISPSILSADFSKLGKEIQDLEKAGADLIHIDVMDGHFVPNLTMGVDLVKALNGIAPLDVHLMITDPVDFIDDFYDAGAEIISVHVEAVTHLHRCVTAIRAAGANAGVVLNPGTPIEAAIEVLSELDMVLIMSVNPGFGGQSFIPAVESKIRKLKQAIDEQVAAGGRPVTIQVDGGVKAHNIAMLRDWGVSNCVVGSGLFNDSASVADNLSIIHQALG